MSLGGAQGLIGTAIGLAARGLALGVVVKEGRGELCDGRDRRKGSTRRNNNIGFDFGGQSMTGKKSSKRRASENIFDLGSTQRPAIRGKKMRSDFGGDFNIFAV